MTNVEQDRYRFDCDELASDRLQRWPSAQITANLLASLMSFTQYFLQVWPSHWAFSEASKKQLHNTNTFLWNANLELTVSQETRIDVVGDTRMWWQQAGEVLTCLLCITARAESTEYNKNNWVGMFQQQTCGRRHGRWQFFLLTLGMRKCYWPQLYHMNFGWRRYKLAVLCRNFTFVQTLALCEVSFYFFVIYSVTTRKKAESYHLESVHLCHVRANRLVEIAILSQVK
jgi:hypothetical protein